MELANIILLKSEVEKIFGRKILSLPDCQSLCDDITENSTIRISFNTLRRLFNLMKGDNLPSIYTLDSLSNYCGFSSFDDFITKRKQVVLTENRGQDQILLNFLTLFFKQIEVCRNNDITYLSLVQHTIQYLQHYPPLIDRFQREIAKTRNGQTFYFERFIFIDKLNSYYGNGLHYYLNEKKTKEAKLFAHSLLCYSSWLTENDEGIEKHYKIVMKGDYHHSKSSAVKARYFSTQIFYANAFGLDEEPILSKMRQFYSSRREGEENVSSLNCFEIILSETLILISRYDEALFYLEKLLGKLKNDLHSYIDVALLENICLLKAIAFAHTGQEKSSYKILQEINPYRFSFLTRQFLNILYLSIRQFFKTNVEEQEQIQYLIQETGFVRLSSIWRNIPAFSNKTDSIF